MHDDLVQLRLRVKLLGHVRGLDIPGAGVLSGLRPGVFDSEEVRREFGAFVVAELERRGRARSRRFHHALKSYLEGENPVVELVCHSEAMRD